MAKLDKDNMGALRSIAKGACGVAGKKKHLGGWQTRLSVLIKEHNHKPLNGEGTVSYKTQQERMQALYRFFRQLTGPLKFGIEDPDNLKVKHIEALVKHWQDKGLADGTIITNMSYLRAICEWMKKPGMVQPTEHYIPGITRKLAAQKDKSFTGNGVDFWEVYAKILAIDKYVAMQLLLGKAFGLREKEAIRFKPHVSDKGKYIVVFDGAKGGRPRTVDVEDDAQRALINQCKNFVGGRRVNSHMGNPDKTLVQNEYRYSNVLRKVGLTKKDLGVTGHGLRAEFALEQLKKHCVLAPFWGGTGKAGTDQQTQIARLQVSEALGHSRTSIITAYSGPLAPLKTLNSPKESNDPVDETNPSGDQSGIEADETDKKEGKEEK